MALLRLLPRRRASRIAFDTLPAAAPDGHTLMMVSSTTLIHPLLYKARHDIVRDFQPVRQVTRQGRLRLAPVGAREIE